MLLQRDMCRRKICPGHCPGEAIDHMRGTLSLLTPQHLSSSAVSNYASLQADLALLVINTARIVLPCISLNTLSVCTFFLNLILSIKTALAARRQSTACLAA